MQHKTRRLILTGAFLIFAFSIVARPVQDSGLVISLKAIAGLQYDLPRFAVKPGMKVTITLTNEDDMSHNLLITAPGSRMEIVNSALQLGEAGPKMQYTPVSQKILWAIPVLLPGEKKSLQFTAPKKKGVYPYVCTYPGHGFIMYGAMHVTDKSMPALKDDPDVPPMRKTDNNPDGHANMHHQEKIPHPYTLTPPYLYRAFVPDAGPAAIVVALPDSLSYCWDAGECRLRYAWSGGFVDMSVLWAGHKQATAGISGAVFYRDKTSFPLRINSPEHIPVVKFKGYRLINRYPEFHYTIDGIDVYELIKEKADGSGLVRTLKIAATDQTIWFVFRPADGVSYATSKGPLENGRIKLTADEAHENVITMTIQKRTRP